MVSVLDFRQDRIPRHLGLFLYLTIMPFNKRHKAKPYKTYMPPRSFKTRHRSRIRSQGLVNKTYQRYIMQVSGSIEKRVIENDMRREESGA